MKWFRWTGAMALCVAGAITGLAEVQLPPDSPFQVILDRNPFGLRPPSTNVVVVQTSAPPAQVNVNLSGITFVKGKKKAWMVIPAGGTRTNSTSFSMAEGDPEFEGVRVEQIDVERGVVRIRKNGVATTLDFDNNGLAYTGPAVATPGALGAVGGRPGRIPAPGQRTAVPSPTMGGRITPGGGPSASVTVSGGASATGATPQVIPARQIRSAQQQTPEPVDPEVQLIQLKAQQIHAQNEGRNFPPLPPVPVLREMEGE